MDITRFFSTESVVLIILAVVAFFMAIAATVLSFIFLVPEKRKARMNRFGQFVHDTLNFKYLLVEKILKALYIFFTAFYILYGFFQLFVVIQLPLGGVYWYGLEGAIHILVYPILLRLAFEVSMMFILLVKNTIEINKKLKNQNDAPASADPFSMPDVKGYVVPTPAAPQASANGFCTNCGAPLNGGSFCSSCGAKVQ